MSIKWVAFICVCSWERAEYSRQFNSLRKWAYWVFNGWNCKPLYYFLAIILLVVLLQVQVTYSTNSGQNYSFFVGFPSGCGLDCDDCSVDVSEENVVLVLVKSEESSEATWKSFTVGLNAAQSTVSWFNYFANSLLSYTYVGITVIINFKFSFRISSFWLLIMCRVQWSRSPAYLTPG